ncbi:hypothetical protein PoB_001753100 [Plakobranchus ocellatus]|uniref:Uncharacterized protein n=1 Tax=Plakobranchus ocellatus TaxID=259542 RepID=A0AAV3YV95_9GAST|nr:hypothetical protein PoB_001753100 [Plakobranchus ocellatus]
MPCRFWRGVVENGDEQKNLDVRQNIGGRVGLKVKRWTLNSLPFPSTPTVTDQTLWTFSREWAGDDYRGFPATPDPDCEMETH